MPNARNVRVRCSSPSLGLRFQKMIPNKKQLSKDVQTPKSGADKTFSADDTWTSGGIVKLSMKLPLDDAKASFENLFPKHLPLSSEFGADRMIGADGTVGADKIADADMIAVKQRILLREGHAFIIDSLVELKAKRSKLALCKVHTGIAYHSLAKVEYANDAHTADCTHIFKLIGLKIGTLSKDDLVDSRFVADLIAEYKAHFPLQECCGPLEARGAPASFRSATPHALSPA